MTEGPTTVAGCGHGALFYHNQEKLVEALASFLLSVCISSLTRPRSSPGQPPDAGRAATARGPVREVVAGVVGASDQPPEAQGGAQQGRRGRLWLYLARVDSGVCAARLQVGVHVAADRARAR